MQLARADARRKLGVSASVRVGMRGCTAARGTSLRLTMVPRDRAEAYNGPGNGLGRAEMDRVACKLF